MREDLKDTYKTLSDYDRHYSTVRATGVIFLFSLSFSIASFLLKDAKDFSENSVFVFIASMIPLFFLVAAFVLSCHFQRLTSACQMYMGAIEKADDKRIIPGGTLTIIVEKSTFDITGKINREGPGLFKWAGIVSAPANEVKGVYTANTAGGCTDGLDQCRKNLKDLIKGKDFSEELKKLLTHPETNNVKLPRFFFLDIPNQILTIALVLLLFLPCLVLALQKHSGLIFLGLIPLIVAAVVVLVIVLCVNIPSQKLQKFILNLPPAIPYVVGVFLLSLAIWSWVLCLSNKEPPLVCHSGINSIGSPVKYFDPNSLDIPETEKSIDSLRSAISSELYDRPRQGCPPPMTLFVVGVINKQDLEREHKLDNGALALARALYIEEKIRNSFSEPSEIMTLSMVAGSSGHGSKNDVNKDDEGMARDGSVTVYGVWAVKPVEGSGAAR